MSLNGCLLWFYYLCEFIKWIGAEHTPWSKSELIQFHSTFWTNSASSGACQRLSNDVVYKLDEVVDCSYIQWIVGCWLSMLLCRWPVMSWWYNEGTLMRLVESLVEMSLINFPLHSASRGSFSVNRKKQNTFHDNLDINNYKLTVSTSERQWHQLSQPNVFACELRLIWRLKKENKYTSLSIVLEIIDYVLFLNVPI